MIDQWRKLKETITELRDNDGTGTQQEVCKFLANYMDVLEKQMIDPIDRVLEIITETEKYEKKLTTPMTTPVAFGFRLAVEQIKQGIEALKEGEQE